MSDKTPNQDLASMPFEQLLEQLEQIVHELEDGQLGLGAALARYEEGIRYLKQCHLGLEQAERRIELLTGVDAEGRPTVANFDDQQLSNEAKVEARSRRRSKPTTTESEAPQRSRDEEGNSGRKLF
ncbi:MAG: Exodeoxyribonuclease 7 small subunit [Planctomycetota bacterium]